MVVILKYIALNNCLETPRVQINITTYPPELPFQNIILTKTNQKGNPINKKVYYLVMHMDCISVE